MDEILPFLLTFPPDKQVLPYDYDRLATAYVKQLNTIQPGAWKAKSDKRSLLELLNPGRNSIAYMFCLVDYLNTPGITNTDLSAILPWLGLFFHQFDPIQIRYAGTQWRTLFSQAADVYRALRITDVSALGRALLRLDPTSGTFTTSHLTYLILCHDATTPSRALCILDKDIYAFPPDSRVKDDVFLADDETSSTFITEKSGFAGKITSAMVLQYYLLGAHVYLGIRNWPRARLFLELVISHPSPVGVTSTFQVEAYKKWVLLGLLCTGKTFALPRTVGQLVSKNIKAIARPYDALAEAFERRNWRKFQAEKDVGLSIWQEDGNTRLVNEVSSALFRYCVADMSKTYAALPISRVATHIGLEPAQTLSLINGLIQSEQLSATVDSSADATLRFTPASATTNIDDVAIEAQTRRIEGLVRSVRDADRRLQLTKEYTEVARRAKKQGGDADLADQMDLEYSAGMPIILADDDDGDEDLMDNAP